MSWWSAWRAGTLAPCVSTPKRQANTKTTDVRRPLAEVARGGQRGVVTTHAVHTAARMCVARAQVQSLDRCAVAKVRKRRAEQQLVVPGVAPSPEVASE